jgi:adenine-specific DNA methylase
LSSGKSYTLLSNEGLITVLENLKIRDQARLGDNFIVEVLLKLLSESDVVANSVGKYDGFLLDVSQTPIIRKMARVIGNLSKNDSQQSTFS